MDQELLGNHPHFSGRNDVIMAAILKVWRQIENPTPSIDAYLLEEQSRQISSQSDLKWRSIRPFWRGRLRTKNMSSDISSVSDPKL